MSDKVIDLDRARDRSPLSHISSALPPGEPAEQINAIFEMDDPPAFLQRLESPVFYRLIKKAGWSDSYDLVQYASPAQIQHFIDFDCWTRDRLIPDKMQKWLSALLTEATDSHLRDVARNLDEEMLAIFFKHNLVVDEMDDGRIPDHLQGNVAPSPDQVYALQYPDDEDLAALMRLLVDRLYAVDRVMAWTLLEASRWELLSEMEEYAYKWRNSRLEEFGFVPRDEAIEVYSYTNPADYRDLIESRPPAERLGSVAPPSHLDLPDVLADELSHDFWMMRALSRLDDPGHIRRVIHQTQSVTNRAMIADGIEPGELESGRQVIRRTLGYASLGLEFLSRADLDTAAQRLREVPVKRIFQVGFSLTRKLQTNLEKLAQRPTLSLVEGDPYSLLNADERALANALSQPRPVFASDALTFDIFERQRQLDSAAVRLGQLALKQLWLFALTQRTPAELASLIYAPDTLNDPTSVTFDSLFATWLAHFLTQGKPSLRPIGPENLDALPQILADRPWEAAPEAFKSLLHAGDHSIPASSRALFTGWVLQTLDTLDEELRALSAAPSPTLLQDVLLVRQEA